MAWNKNKITILLSTCNRADFLAQTLNDLASQQVEFDLEWRVIAVNNASTDETAAVLKRFEQDSGLALLALHEPRPGKPCALNLGLAHIDAGLVVFIDDDVALKPDWLQAYADAARRWPEHAIFGGPVTPVFPEQAPAWVQDERYVRQSPVFARYNPRTDEGLTMDVPLGPNMAIRREAMGEQRFDERLGPGGSHDLMGDETEFEFRLARLGYQPFVFVPTAGAEHRVRPEQMTLDYIWQRAYLWGRSMALTEGRSRKGPFIKGVPLRYWIGAGRALLRYLPFHFGPQHFRLRYGWQWQVRAGRVRGYLDSRPE